MTRGRKVALALIGGVPVFFAAGLWLAGNQLLHPAWRGATKDFTVCGAELTAAWGDGCGNLRLNGALRFSEVTVPSPNGYDLPGWLVRAADNGRPSAPGAIMLVHGGGSDRREVTRHAPYFLDRGLDVLTLDLGCHGEAPCPVAGLSYGERESQDVVAAYLYLAERYPQVVAMGSSVGAASLLIALPAMPHLAGVIAENPMAGFDRLIRETPASQSIPSWFTGLLIESVKRRGRFTALLSPENSLALVKDVPIFFIHSRRDEIVPVLQSQELAGRYRGPKTTWWPEHGAHSAIWDSDPAAYEARLTAFLAGLVASRLT
jgi:pimeloyl-ACP methyl ester carboxylesterase